MDISKIVLIFGISLLIYSAFLFLGFDIGYWLEEALKFLSYEIPKESFKYFPIYFVLKSIWIKN